MPQVIDALTVAQSLDATGTLWRAAWGDEPTDWQRRAAAVARAGERDVLVLASRQSGKSRLAALVGVESVVAMPGALTVICSPSLRQSREMLRKARRLIRGARIPLARENTTTLELESGSRVLCLAANEDTARGFTVDGALILDEAVWIDDAVYHALLPSTAAGRGVTVAISSAGAERGWFWRAWMSGNDWHRERIPAERVPWLRAAHLERERARLGPQLFAAEYGADFMAARSGFLDPAAIARAVSPAVQALRVRVA
jgi:hypothetical protein